MAREGRGFGEIFFEVGDLGVREERLSRRRKGGEFVRDEFTRLELMWIKERVERLGWKFEFGRGRIWERKRILREHLLR